jgi:recombination protein RecT
MSTEIATTGKNDIRSLLASDTFKSQVALSLPSHMTPDRFARVALTALTRTPKLMDCTRESLLRCLMDCSSLGLEPDGRHAHLIPYKDTVTLVVDWKGLVALARRSGDVVVFRAELVKEKDSFSWTNGTVTHDINWRTDRGKTECVYSYVRFKDGAEDWEVMTLAEVEAIRRRSKSPNAGPWVTDFDEMARKTVIRRHSKRLTLSPEFSDALDKDDDRLESSVSYGKEIKEAVIPQPLPLPSSAKPKAKSSRGAVDDAGPAMEADLLTDDPRKSMAELVKDKLEVSALSWSDVCQWIEDNGGIAGSTVEETADAVLALVNENFHLIHAL